LLEFILVKNLNMIKIKKNGIKSTLSLTNLNENIDKKKKVKKRITINNAIIFVRTEKLL
tara:strand:- start:111 stop:287 length:177 start_codon:yes stop_codon:yes gene_type:complete